MRKRANEATGCDGIIDERLAALREAHGGSTPDIVFIPLDDVGYGEIGTPE